MLQFRSVRMLIAQDQLEQVSRQVRLSEQPVVVADPGGRILLTNEAFERLLGTTHAASAERLEDLPAFFADPALVRRSLRELLSQRRTWRGEVSLVTEARRQSRSWCAPIRCSPPRTRSWASSSCSTTSPSAARPTRPGAASRRASSTATG